MSHTSPLRIAVVGHTNTGKTSFVRTLLQNTSFGDVSDRPSTTRDVRKAELKLDDQVVMEIFDTPGLEDGLGLYHFIQTSAEQSTSMRHNGPAQINGFLESQAAAEQFEQEAKVLRQLLNSDAAFYLIDCRDPVLPKYQDELDILRRCGKPILPVLNFTTHAENHVEDWKQALAQVNLHGWVEFDTVSLPEEGDQQLFQHLATLLPGQRQQLESVRQQRLAHAQQRLHATRQEIAELLLDTAAYCVRVENSDKDALAQTLAQMQRRVVAREQRCVQAILTIFAFPTDSASLQTLAVQSDAWQAPLFASETLKQFGIQASKGIAAGGAAGAGFDLMLGGLSLGAGTLLGAAAGGLWQGWQQYGRRLKHAVQGYSDVYIRPEIIRLLAARQQHLVQLLTRRGHAAVTPLRLVDEQAEFHEPQRFREFMQRAHQHSEWSSLHEGKFADTIERSQCLRLLE
ncbi:MAG: GTPase/DUF3482 domain-containing protein [Aliidiomarina sp.]|uniref:GTPase/DUF3482 domain-containing protein n=1 Tax=Aliidiomarina sp. TaxID=1872439 RepID=UPI0025C501B9|nr:GTPase/DUF3482 domain-containing protein [Aliidiomarina sp.]MCH8500394.1 GTPase/DUF3482 domain-containing protein [Aliidiomarina sp.]